MSLPAPRAGQVVGVLAPTASGLSSFQALRRIDPDLRLVDLRWGGRLIFVRSDRADLPSLAHRVGVLFLFDAALVGCGVAGDAAAGGRAGRTLTPPARLWK
jgi:hypothetical protein